MQDTLRDHPSPMLQLLAKFRETGSVLDLPKCGRKKTVINEETLVAVLASFSKSPQRSTRRMSLESGISRTSLRQILATNKWYPYKLQLLQHLSEDDPDQCTEFAEWTKQKLEQDPQFTQKILFSDEANFYVNGEVNKQNQRYWSDTNPHWMDPSKTVGRTKVMVWCGIWDTTIVGPFFINGNLKATGYLKLLHDDVFPSLWKKEKKRKEKQTKHLDHLYGEKKQKRKQTTKSNIIKKTAPSQ
uniref:Uncharacterized protein n=1 Tax=Astatotilapia calliptera TaxID=8154 RepID=A0AAX7TH63_ASTCA